MSTLNPQQTAVLPGVVRVVPNSEKDTLVTDLLGVPEHSFDLEPVAREPIPGSRLKTRAFIKAQDGCDNRCTFCITTVARGAGRSRTVEQVLADIRAARLGGALEAVLTGVHLGSWGHDFDEPQHLGDLIREVLQHSDVPRLRISSLEPWDISPDFFDLWQDKRLCRHLHLPLQSGSEAVLRRMARKTTPLDYAELVDAARARIPGMAITTDVIVGFPGESEAQFQTTYDLVASQRFDAVHIAKYSPRPGTPAARLPDDVPPAEKERRRLLLEELQTQIALGINQPLLGQVVDVLVEESRRGKWRGRIVSNRLVFFVDDTQNWRGRIAQVRILSAGPWSLSGELVGQG